MPTSVAFTPFAFASRRGSTQQEVDECLQAGLEAAEAALALGRPDLASAALDGAGSALVTIGDYGRNATLIDRRLTLLERFDDPWESGDVHDMAAWNSVMIGNYGRAKEYSDHSLELIRTGIEGLAIHGLSWGAMAELQLGHWSRVVDEIGPTVERLLGPRIDHPPYFSQCAFGALAVITTAREDARAERYIGILRTMAAGADEADIGHGGIKALLAWALLVRGSLDEAGTLLQQSASIPFLGHAPVLRPVQADHLAAAELWDAVPAFADGARRYATEAGVRALPFHVDRLEGRAALAAGEYDRAADFLERASSGLAELSARWEGARTDLFLAEAL